MKVNDIIKAFEICFITSDKEKVSYCTQCPLFNMETRSNCQTLLAKLTIEKLQSMRELIDDKVNHHYYDMLEEYQEENSKLREQLTRIQEILEQTV